MKITSDLVGAFNQEKALVGAFSVIVQPVVEPMEHYTALTQEDSSFKRKLSKREKKELKKAEKKEKAGKGDESMADKLYTGQSLVARR